MPQDVVRCGRGVTRYKPSKEELAEYCRQKVEPINATSNPGPGRRRRFCNPFHRYSCAHSGFFRKLLSGSEPATATMLATAKSEVCSIWLVCADSVSFDWVRDFCRKEAITFKTRFMDDKAIRQPTRPSALPLAMASLFFAVLAFCFIGADGGVRVPAGDSYSLNNDRKESSSIRLLGASQ